MVLQMIASMSPLRMLRFACALALACAVAPAQAQTWHIARPIIKGSVAAATPDPSEIPAPLRKDEARKIEEAARITLPSIYVEGRAEREGSKPAPGTLEQRFADVLNRGNPEVPGGSIRHGAFYDGFLYWGSDPLSFLWLNTVNRLRN
jgi:hypothetical protein